MRRDVLRIRRREKKRDSRLATDKPDLETLSAAISATA
jgi:hypothetical protein